MNKKYLVWLSMVLLFTGLLLMFGRVFEKGRFLIQVGLLSFVIARQEVIYEETRKW